MKRKEATLLLVLATAIVIAVLPVQGQTVSPNVKVNAAMFEEASLDGGAKTIAVVNDTVYTIWQGKPTDSTSHIYFAKSVDGGASFTPEVDIAPALSTLYHAFPTLAVSQNGAIHIAWVAVTMSPEAYNIVYTKSVNGGATFTTPLPITTTNAAIFPSVGAHNNHVYIMYADASNYPAADYFFTRSVNNGSSFSTPVTVNDMPCAGDIMYEGLTSLALSPSGAIYLAWVDGRRGNGNGDIFLTKSVDGGLTFSANVMVNDISQPGADSAQFLPSIAVDAADNVYVSFTDLRLGNIWEHYRVYIAKSNDGGATFSPEALLAGHNETCKYHDIAAGANGKLYAALCTHIMPHWGVWLYESTNQGSSFSTPVALSDSFDYNFFDVRIITDTAEKVYALWIDDREGYDNVYFTKTDFGTGIPEGNSYDKSIVYPNPAHGPVFIKVPYGTMDLEITICNLQGQVVYKSNTTGSSTLRVETDMPRGVYFVNIHTPKGIETTKLIKL